MLSDICTTFVLGVNDKFLIKPLYDMKDFNDFADAANEFDGMTEEELLDEFMNEESIADDAYVSLYGLYAKKMGKLTSASKDLFVWMAFNCEVDKGRICMQSFAQQTALRELGITSVTYYRCLGELKKNDLIRGHNARYYINPRVSWRGCSSRREKFLHRYPYLSNEK